MDDLVLVETRDRVRTITLHRPEVRNALDSALQRASARALIEAEADPDVDVVVLTGSDPAFCAGLDLRELGSTGGNLMPADGGGNPSNPFTALWSMRTPVIGAINGPAVTGGFELALACDFLVASTRATFGDTHARVGVTPGGGMSVFLPMAVGLRRAKEISLTGNFVGADEAERIGLVNLVVEHSELLPTALRIAADIVGNDQRAVRNLKALYDRTAAVAPGDGMAIEQQVFRSWRVEPAEVASRRESVLRRGREQQE